MPVAHNSAAAMTVASVVATVAVTAVVVAVTAVVTVVVAVAAVTVVVAVTVVDVGRSRKLPVESKKLSLLSTPSGPFSSNNF